MNSTASELVKEAAATLNHGAAILRLASMEAAEHDAATDLWRRAKAVEELARPLASSLEADGALGPRTT